MMEYDTFGSGSAFGNGVSTCTFSSARLGVGSGACSGVVSRSGLGISSGCGILSFTGNIKFIKTFSLAQKNNPTLF